MTLKLVIKNTSEKAIYLRFSSAKTHDFYVTDFRKKPVWQWSHGRLFAQAFQARTLPGNQSMSFTANWHQQDNQNRPVPVGKYYIDAEFGAVDRGARIGPRSIDIVAR